jgi:hypothetical protein
MENGSTGGAAMASLRTLCGMPTSYLAHCSSMASLLCGTALPRPRALRHDGAFFKFLDRTYKAGHFFTAAGAAAYATTAL